MGSKVKVYLVGEHDAQKTNSWLMMTNDKLAAVDALLNIPDGQIKTIEVSDDDSQQSS